MDDKQTEIALKLLRDYQSNPIVVNQGEEKNLMNLINQDLK
ncbi:MAG: hypothetical protein QXL94_05460 [Candidatus Parvarchaeum sp.]